MYLLIIYLPFVVALATLIFSNKIGRNGACIITIGGMGITNLLSYFIYAEVCLAGSPCFIPLFNWIDIGFIFVEWAHFFDSLTCTMLIAVTLVSFCVHIFSASYMRYDPNLPRFMAYLTLFTFFMIMLVTSPNFLQLFIGWEGVGLCSYLLISFWYHRIQTSKSALKAILINRVGDIGLSIAIYCIFNIFKTADFSVISMMAPYVAEDKINVGGMDFYTLDFICFFIFLGVIGKSSQFLLHGWLPDAMEGPTPVSALIHAATMVTAGVYLVARVSSLFEHSHRLLAILGLFGFITFLYAGIVGAVQLDIKKIIAYSTCGQLGYMVYGFGSSSYGASIFHLGSHAFYKALLFLSAGIIIHAIEGEQDIRRMGNLAASMPYTYLCFSLGSIALMAYPPYSGYYSKDYLIEVGNTVLVIDNEVFQLASNAASLLSTTYSFLTLFAVFHNESAFSPSLSRPIHDADFLSGIALLPLLIGSICVGFWWQDFYVGPATDFWNDSIEEASDLITQLFIEFSDQDDIELPFDCTLLGLYSAIIISHNDFITPIKENEEEDFYDEGLFYDDFLEAAEEKLHMDRAINETMTQPFLSLSYLATYQDIDRGLFEFVGPRGVVQALYDKIFSFHQMKYDFIFQIIFVFLIAANLFIFGMAYLEMLDYFFDYVLIILAIVFFYFENPFFNDEQNIK